MSIKIILEPDVYVTADELARYRDEYNRAFSYYAGTPPTFESWMRRKKAARQEFENDVSGER